MPEIHIAKETTSQEIKTSVNTVNTKVGVNTDVAGTATIFARLKQIYDYLAGTILTAINGRQVSWGAVAGTKTNIDNTWSRVNTNLDKKISEISGGTDLVNMTLGTLTSKMNQFSVNTNHTLFSIIGSGVIHKFDLIISGNTGVNTIRPRIIVNGVTHIFHHSDGSIITDLIPSTTSFLNSASSNSNLAKFSLSNIGFKNNCTIELFTTDNQAGTANINSLVVYSKQ